MCDYEPKEQAWDSFSFSFGICKEACTLLTAGVVVADILCPTQAGAADGWMHLKSFLWCPVWSGDYFVPLGEMGEMGGDGARCQSRPSPERKLLPQVHPIQS